MYCEPIHEGPPVIDEFGAKTWSKEITEARILSVASPELVPRPNLARLRNETEVGEEEGNGWECVVAGWGHGGRELVKRALRSRVGLV